LRQTLQLAARQGGRHPGSFRKFGHIGRWICLELAQKPAIDVVNMH
jgi:hypothetical protein